jgi:hypothetical protein
MAEDFSATLFAEARAHQLAHPVAALMQQHQPNG